jgi:signal transduction histidine kinase
MDAGRLSVASESLDLVPLGEILATEFGPRAQSSQHTLEVELPEMAAALGDEERVLQIGRILIENALVHTPPGTVVRLTAAVDADRSRLSVSDSGPGIPTEAQQHVFDRFYRLDGGRASGSGLGLAIARELASLMGGRLELDSTPHLTRFTLVLPADSPAVTREPVLA